MLDDMIDWLAGAAARPVWERMPDSKRAELRAPLPRGGTAMDAVYEDFRRLVLPYSSANEHPRMMGWVNGGGSAAGFLAELLTGVFNVNCGGRDHAAIEVERQVIAWAAEMVGMPARTTGVLLTGSSMANMVAVLVARRAALGAGVRAHGLQSAPLVAYASAAAHGCVPRALDMAGLGTEALRLVPAGADHRMDVGALREMISADRAAGLHPFLIVGTAGTVDTGAIDDLSAIADVTELLRVAVADMAEFDSFYKRLIAAVPLKNVTSRFAMERLKHTTAYPLSSRAFRDRRSAEEAEA